MPVGDNSFAAATQMASVSDFGVRDLPRSLTNVPKTSNEHANVDNEYKGRNGARGTVSKTDGFGDWTSISGNSRFAEHEPGSATET